MADDEARINVVGPDGWTGSIPLSSLEQAKQMGYQVESGESIHGRQLEQKYGDSPVSSGLEGLARGATFGLSDSVLPSFGVSEEGLRERKARNPLAAGIGEAGGFVATAALTGGSSLAGAAGEAAFAGSGLLARAGAAAVRTGLEGGTFGLGQGISDVALAKDPMSAEAIVGQISHRVLVGAGLGAAAGAGVSLAAGGLGAALGQAGKVVRKVADKFQDELVDDSGGALASADPALRTEVMAMSKPALEAAQTAEQASLDATRATQGTALAKDLETFRYDVRSELFKIKEQLPRGQGLVKEMIRPEAALHNAIGDLKSLAEDPSIALGPLRRIEQQLGKMGDLLPEGTVKPTLDRLGDLQNRIANLTGDTTSPRLEAISARLDALGAGPKATPTLDAMSKGAGASIGAAVGHATGLPYGGVAGAWLGKELAQTIQPLMKKVLGSFVDHSAAIADGAENFMAKLSAPSPALDALKDLAAASAVTAGNDWQRASKGLSDAAANPQQTEGHLRQELAGLAHAAPQLADQVVQGLMAKVQFLAGKLPPAAPTGFGAAALPPSDTEQSTFARYVAAATDPLRILKELGVGRVMPETVETLGALFPAMRAKIMGALTTQLADPTVAAKVSYPMRLQLGILLGPQVEPTLAPDFVALMQQSFTQPPQGGKPPGGGTANPAQNATAAQRLTMR